MYQHNAIYYHDSNGQPLNCYRHTSAKRLAITMSDRILITLVDNNGTSTLGKISAIMLEDGSGKNFIVRMMDKDNKIVDRFVKDKCTV